MGAIASLFWKGLKVGADGTGLGDSGGGKSFLFWLAMLWVGNPPAPQMDPMVLGKVLWEQKYHRRVSVEELLGQWALV